MIKNLAVGLAPLLVAAAATLAVPAVALASDVQVQLLTRNSTTNAGPFSSGTNAIFETSFRIDGSVAPTGATPTWNGALDDLVLTITDTALGTFTIHAQDGKWRQQRSNIDFLFGGWGGINGGSITPFEVVIPATSATPFVLESITFDFRGGHLFSSPLVLPGQLSHAPSPAATDFSNLDLTLNFSNADPLVGIEDKGVIMRGAAFLSVNVSPVPEPAAASMLLAGLLVMGTLARRRS